MLDLIKKSISTASTHKAKIYITREFLQLLILKILYDNYYFRNLVILFHKLSHIPCFIAGLIFILDRFELTKIND